MRVDWRDRRLWLGVAGVVVVAAAAWFFLLRPEGELSEQEFVSRGDEICKDAHDQFAELQEDPPQSAAEAADLTGNLIEISESELAQIRDLNAPAELDEQVDRYLAEREEGIAILREGQEAAEHDDAQGYAKAQAEVAEGQLERTKLAKQIGFSECSRPLATEE